MGLVQRVLEARGLPTVALSMIPELTRAVGVPRLLGIGYPMGRPLGRPHDADGQRAVLRAMLDLLETAKGPGHLCRAPVRVAGVTCSGATRVQGCSAAPNRRTSEEETVAVGEPLQRPHSARLAEAGQDRFLMRACSNTMAAPSSNHRFFVTTSSVGGMAPLYQGVPGSPPSLDVVVR